MLCVLPCGEQTGVDIADSASGHEEEFREALHLRHGLRSHANLLRVLGLHDPHDLEQALSAGLAVTGRHPRHGSVLAMDGKAL